MSIMHQFSAVQVLAATARQLRLAGALQLHARQAGWLQVDDGQVWITRSGEGVDHVLAAGQALPVDRGQALLLEPWRPGDVARLRWAAGPAAAPGGLARAGAALDGAAAGRVDQTDLRLRGPAAGGAGLAWRALARGLRAAAGRLAAAARSADARASRAQGSICAGDSMASSGALQ